MCHTMEKLAVLFLYLKDPCTGLHAPTFRLYKKIDKKSRIFLAQNCLKRIKSQLLEYTKKIDKKSGEKKIEKLF